MTTTVKRIQNEKFNGRYLPYEQVEKTLQSLPDYFHLKKEGQSVLGRAIYSVEIGQGHRRVLIWSQMHGNESTTTKALFDFFEAVKQHPEEIEGLLQNCRLKIIPVLNPDGAIAYTRRNANDVDLNRDAVEQSQPESRLLQMVAQEFHPDFCFNMHGQRTIFGVGDSDKSATMSFLSPACNSEKKPNKACQIAQQLIAGINEDLQGIIPGQVGRYDDTYNPNCVGDFFQNKNIPTVLFEAGHFHNDYQREKTRELVSVSLFKGLKLISDQSWSSYSLSSYYKIPENKKSFYDILIRNAVLDNKLTDIAVQYEEVLIKGMVTFIPKIADIRNLQEFHGHNEIEADKQNVKIFMGNSMNIGLIVRKILINDKVTTLTLTNN